MTVEIIDDIVRLNAFAPEWSRFAQSTSGLTPFQLPEWQITWWRHFGNGRLHVLVFREQGEVAAVIPCFLHEWQGLRQFTLIGSGISDYLDPAIRPQHSSEVVERLRSHLCARSDWDVCNWQDLSFDTPLRDLASELREDVPCREIRLTGSFEDYWQTCSKDVRRNVKRYSQKAEARGALDFEVLATPEPEAIDALIQLHTARWRRVGEPGMIQANGSAEFIRDVAVKFERCNILRIFCLRVDDRIAGVILSFPYGDSLFSYLSAFDPEYEELGLGRILLYRALKYSFENGFRTWNFLRGDEPYKSWWGAHAIPKCRVIVSRRV